jgi:hypothetical protein
VLETEAYVCYSSSAIAISRPFMFYISRESTALAFRYSLNQYSFIQPHPKERGCVENNFSNHNCPYLNYSTSIGWLRESVRKE